MVVGQQHDLESEGKSLTLPEIEIIHINKTGALIAFSANAGAKIAGADGEVGKAISDYAEGLGLLFQITDDLLDVTASTEELGKTAGKDEAAGKATYPSVLGVEATRAKIAEVRERIVSVLEKVPGDTSLLKSIGDFLVFRNF
jgi:geranylgeranyl diphosphate synthase type II